MSFLVGHSKRIPGCFNQIIFQIRFRNWSHINTVRLRWLGFLPTHLRLLIKRQIREFPQQTIHPGWPRPLRIDNTI
jgi:hypothetical protein